MGKHKKREKSIHDRTIDDIVRRLSESNIRYSTIKNNREYKLGRCKSVSGEIDTYAIYRTPKNVYGLIFEVKSTNKGSNEGKAHKQLNRAQQYLMNYLGTNRVFKFYCIPNHIKWYITEIKKWKKQKTILHPSQ